MERKAKQTKKRSPIATVAAVLILLIGLSLLLYPTASDYIHSLEYKRIIDDYRGKTGKLDEASRRGLLEEAYVYNAELFGRTDRLEELDPAQRERYYRVLDPLGTGVMGYVEIRKVDVYLPIYHGTDEDVLHSGVGHLEGSSLPVGGENVHTLLSAHSGLPSAKLFSNIDQLEPGDTFTLHILDEVLTYQVESTVTVLPEKVGDLRIEPGKDICTLMTCTPYGVNTHRLLVRGIRIPTPETEEDPPGGEKIPAPLPPVLWAVPAVLLLLILAAVFRRRKRRRRRRRR